METLRDTFKQNYKFLSEGAFSDDGKSYTWKVLTIHEVIDNLNESVEKMNCKGELRKFLQMMMVNFVRFHQLTVIPFPVKYLREFIQLEEKKKSAKKDVTDLLK